MKTTAARWINERQLFLISSTGVLLTALSLCMMLTALRWGG